MGKKTVKSKLRAERRSRLYRQQEGRCRGCKQVYEIDKMTFDHILPQCRGGTNAYKNVELLCRPCNAFKADHYPWDWSQFIWDTVTRSLKHVSEMRQAG